MTIEKKILNAILYTDDIFNSFYGFLAALKEKSEGYLQFALTQYPSHQPHMALFIAFLQLFQLAQEQANELTGKMLDFYYREVLRLVPKPSIADRAYIVFQLAKDIVTYDLAEGTQLKAGKDKSGIEQIYQSETALVVNQARVKELKTIFIDKGDEKSSLINAIYAAPIANSLDGFGKAFPAPGSKWPTFGKGRPKLKRAKNICEMIARQIEITDQQQAAQIGFALASPQLVMQGGRRLLTWTFMDFETAFANFKTTQFQVWLTGDKDWIKLKVTEDEILIRALRHAGETGKFMIDREHEAESYFIADKKLFVYLPISSEAVIPFNQEIHKGFSYNTRYPVMQVMIGPDITLDFQTFENLSFSNQSLFVKVGSINQAADVPDFDVTHHISSSGANMDGLKKLVLKNDDGFIDAGKPFDPFTAYPTVGNSLYIGSDEIFNKPVNELSINVQFVSEATVTELKEARLGSIKLSLRDRKEWVELLPHGDNEQEFTFASIRENVLEDQRSIKPPTRRKPIVYNKDLGEDTFKGFIQIQNNPTSSFFFRKTNLYEILQQISSPINNIPSSWIAPEYWLLSPSSLLRKPLLSTTAGIVSSFQSRLPIDSSNFL